MIDDVTFAVKFVAAYVAVWFVVGCAFVATWNVTKHVTYRRWLRRYERDQ